MLKLKLLLLFASLSSYTITITTAFPAGRCYEPSCNAAPYSISTSFDASQPNKFCLTFQKKACQSANYDCCSRFTQNLPKFVISSRPECNNSLSMVTIDGVKKGGGVYFSKINEIEAELRVTALTMDEEAVLSSKICFELRSDRACPTLMDYCRLPLSNSCKVALFDPRVHDCCPTCPLYINGDSAPPMRKSPPPFVPAEPTSPRTPSPITKSPPPSPTKKPPSPPSPVFVNDTKLNNMVCNCSCINVQ